MSKFSDLPSLLPFHLCQTSLRQLNRIETYFGSLEVALSAKAADWQHADILTATQVATLLDGVMAKSVAQTLEWGGMADQFLVAFGDAAYPSLLKSIDDAPILLSVRGNVALLSDPQLAIVGSRHASKQGINTAKDFAQYLSSQGLTITSGLALGIDTAAHQGGLQGMGKTVAVVATGLDRIYPAANQALGRQVAQEGAMVSEYPLGSKPLAYHFPKRNRIISGLSVGTLVVEAALKSGSLITAKLAADQGREVFAVPGSINNPQAKGCHQLIKLGAKLVESGQDVLEELSPLIQLTMQDEQKSLNSLTHTESSTSAKRGSTHKILQWIEYDPIGLDELVVLSKSPVSEIQSQLMLLEIAGEIEALSGGRWRRIK